MLGKPLMNRIVTVTGDAIADPRNFIVRIGTNYHELVEEAGGLGQRPFCRADKAAAPAFTALHSIVGKECFFIILFGSGDRAFAGVEPAFYRSLVDWRYRRRLCHPCGKNAFWRGGGELVT